MTLLNKFISENENFMDMKWSIENIIIIKIYNSLFKKLELEKSDFLDKLFKQYIFDPSGNNLIISLLEFDLFSSSVDGEPKKFLTKEKLTEMLYNTIELDEHKVLETLLTSFFNDVRDGFITLNE